MNDRLNDVEVKKQPKHIGHAENVTLEILKLFNVEEQNEILKHIKNGLIEARCMRISSLHKEAEYLENCNKELQ